MSSGSEPTPGGATPHEAGGRVEEIRKRRAAYQRVVDTAHEVGLGLDEDSVWDFAGSAAQDIDYLLSELERTQRALRHIAYTDWRDVEHLQAIKAIAAAALAESDANG